MKPAKVVDMVRAIPAREARSTVINRSRMVVTEIDGYRNHRGLVHGVEKDGIQTLPSTGILSSRASLSLLLQLDP
jgi:hypothetical protein